MVQNLLDNLQTVEVYTDSGRADWTTSEAWSAAYFSGEPRLLEEYFDRPDFYAPPRRIFLGLKLKL